MKKSEVIEKLRSYKNLWVDAGVEMGGRYNYVQTTIWVKTDDISEETEDEIREWLEEHCEESEHGYCSSYYYWEDFEVNVSNTAWDE